MYEKQNCNTTEVYGRGRNEGGGEPNENERGGHKGDKKKMAFSKTLVEGVGIPKWGIQVSLKWSY